MRSLRAGRRPRRALAQLVRAGEVPGHARDVVGSPVAADEDLEERERGVEHARQLRTDLIVGALLDEVHRGIGQVERLVVHRLDAQEVIQRPGRLRLDGGHICPRHRGAVVPPPDRVQHGHGTGLERVPLREPTQVHGLRIPLVVRDRPRPDLSEHLFDLIAERTPGGVERPEVRVRGMEVGERVEIGDRPFDGSSPLARNRADGLAELRAGHAWRDRAQSGVVRRGCRPLREAVIAVAPHGDTAVAPVLLRDPVDRVVAVVRLVHEQQRLALGAELAAHVLRDDAVPALHEVLGDERDERVGAVLVIRQADEDDIAGCVVITGQVHVGGQTHSVAHADGVLGGQRADRCGTDVDDVRHGTPSLMRWKSP